jgi:hypothetical protein
LDGGEFNHSLNNLPLPSPTLLQEFKVETSSLPAQYGEHSGGAVNAITKSGSNEFHGGAFEFVRNYLFNARNFLATQRDSLKRNQFGGYVGGPIKKDKLFFFIGYQGTLIRSNQAQNFSFIPTPQIAGGRFHHHHLAHLQFQRTDSTRYSAWLGCSPHHLAAGVFYEELAEHEAQDLEWEAGTPAQTRNPHPVGRGR